MSVFDGSNPMMTKKNQPLPVFSGLDFAAKVKFLVRICTRSGYWVVKLESCLHSDAYIFSSSNGGVEIVCSAERSLQGLHDGVLRFNEGSSTEILHGVKVGQFRD